MAACSTHFICDLQTLLCITSTLYTHSAPLLSVRGALVFRSVRRQSRFCQSAASITGWLRIHIKRQHLFHACVHSNADTHFWHRLSASFSLKRRWCPSCFVQVRFKVILWDEKDWAGSKRNKLFAERTKCIHLVNLPFPLSIPYQQRVQGQRGCLVEYVGPVCLTHWSFTWLRFAWVRIYIPNHGSKISAA